MRYEELQARKTNLKNKIEAIKKINKSLEHITIIRERDERDEEIAKTRLKIIEMININEVDDDDYDPFRGPEVEPNLMKWKVVTE